MQWPGIEAVEDAGCGAEAATRAVVGRAARPASFIYSLDDVAGLRGGLVKGWGGAIGHGQILPREASHGAG